MSRSVNKVVRGVRATDGAGVNLVRVLGNNTTSDFDPFLMLDSFDSKNSDDYIAGFPMHPHRGIETLTYLVNGEIKHEDSMGNKGVIRDGEAQWMTAGSGILHEEMPQAAPRMLGFQLWINLPSRNKMAPPHYAALDATNIGIYEDEGFTVRVLSGEYRGVHGFSPLYVQAQVYDVATSSTNEVAINVGETDTAYLFLLVGDAEVSGEMYQEKSAILLNEGSEVRFRSKGAGGRVILFSAPRLDEAIAWGGPIVMNTRQELVEAFNELRDGTFIKK